MMLGMGAKILDQVEVTMRIKQTIVLAASLLMSASLAASSEIEKMSNVGLGMESLSANEVSVSPSKVAAYAVSLSGNIAAQGLASAQSTFPGYDVNNIKDGDRNTTVGGSYSWANGHTYTTDGRLPQWVQLAYSSEKTFSKVVLYTSTGYELKDYDIQVRSGSNWITVASQRGNTSVTRIHSFNPTRGTILRVLSLRGPDNQYVYARINELEVFETAPNLALTATATAQSSYPGYSPSRVKDGNTNTQVGGAYSWANGHTYTNDGRLPQWLQLDFGAVKALSKVVLYTSQGYEIKDYDVQVWTGSSWSTVVSIRGNTSVKRTHNFSLIYGSKLRVKGIRGPDNQSVYVRVNELEVY